MDLMKKVDARKLSPSIQEERRKQAIRLRKQRYSILEISKIVGVHYGTACRWFREYDKNGIPGIVSKTRGRSLGDSRTLTIKQEKMIKNKIIKNTPEKFGFNLRLWTRAAVKLLIKRVCSINMPIRTIGEYLKRWRFTPQKPKKCANEKNMIHVQTWLKKEYPKILKRAKKEGAEIHWGDETGICNIDQTGRGYAPIGKTPVVKLPGKMKFRINLISSITNQGKVRFMIFEKSMNESILLKFFSRLVQDVEKKVFLILDNLNIHKAKKVRGWLQEQKSKIEVFYLPTYSPDLNPDEFLNCDLKAGLSSKSIVLTKADLKKSVLSQMRMLQKTPNRVKAYFKAESIKYAA